MKTFYEFFRKGLFVTFAVNFIFLNSCSATNIKIYMPKLDSKTAKKIIIKGTAVVNYPKKGGSIIDDYYYGKFENLEVLKAYEISELKYCEIKCFVRKFENSDSWEAVVSPDKPQCTKEKLYFRIYGLKSKPEQVEFYKEISLNEIQSDDTYYNLQEDNFIINDRKADRIEFDTLTTESNTTEGEYWHYPRVKLYFDNEKAESENGKTELPEDTINEVNSNQFNLFGNKTELNFFNNKGKIIASRVWEGPFNSLHIPEEMKNYKKIELRTSLFTCFCTKPSLKKIGIHDFFKTVTVEVNAPFLQFSYISDKDEIPFYVYKELTESEIHLQLPVTIPEEKIKWILLAIGQNNQYIEKELSIDDSKIDMRVPKPYSIKIKATPADSNVFIKSATHIFREKTDEKGNFSKTLFFKPKEEISIFVSKLGYKTHESIWDKKNDGNYVEVNLTEIPKDLHLIRLKKNIDTYNNLGGDYNALSLVATNEQDQILFNGYLKNADCLPSNSKKYRLQDNNKIYTFPAKTISSALKDPFEINAIPNGRYIIIELDLKHNKKPIKDKNTVFYIKGKPQPIKYNKGTFSGKLLFPYSNNNGELIAKPVTIRICSPNFDLKSIKIYPKNEKNNILKKDISFDPTLPDVIVLLSGNENTTKKYWTLGRDALKKLWKGLDGNIFAASNGKINKFEKEDSLRTYQGEYESSDEHINSEIKKAISKFTEKEKDNCGRHIPRFLIYIARTESENTIKYKGDIKLLIVSPESKPTDWKYDWKQATTESDIEAVIKNVLTGNYR